MLAPGQLGERQAVGLLEWRPLALIQTVRVEQSFTRSEFPFIPARERHFKGAVLGNGAFFIAQSLDLRLRRIRISLGMIHTQASGSAGPKAPALVLVQAANAAAGQAVFDPVLDPASLEETL